MKKFIVRVLIFFAVVAVIDVVFGFACRYLNSHSTGGDTKLHCYITNECDADILIFGSSRAFHHYVPRIIEDSLGMSCYNCGTDGNGIVFLYGRLLMMTERYTPKLIIYDYNKNFDIVEGDNMKYLKWQKRYYNKTGLSDIFELISTNEKYKMWSQLYRYNGDFIQMLIDNIHPIQEVNIGGFRPVNKTMTYEPKIGENPKQTTEWDPVKYECMIHFINLCKEKGIKLIFCLSPSYGGNDYGCEDLITKLCEKYDIAFINYYKDPGIVLNKDYFYDSIHMNETGATEFTKRFVGEIESILDKL